MSIPSSFPSLRSKISAIFDLVFINNPNKHDMLNKLVSDCYLLAMSQVIKNNPAYKDYLNNVKGNIIDQTVTDNVMDYIDNNSIKDEINSNFKIILDKYINTLLPTLNKQQQDQVTQLWQT
jgi:hypothetical protein